MAWSDNVEKIIMVAAVLFAVWVYLELKNENTTLSQQTQTL
jgi:hypothetical protein